MDKTDPATKAPENVGQEGALRAADDDTSSTLAGIVRWAAHELLRGGHFCDIGGRGSMKVAVAWSARSTVVGWVS